MLHVNGAEGCIRTNVNREKKGAAGQPLPHPRPSGNKLSTTPVRGGSSVGTFEKGEVFPGWTELNKQRHLPERNHYFCI